MSVQVIAFKGTAHGAAEGHQSHHTQNSLLVFCYTRT